MTTRKTADAAWKAYWDAYRADTMADPRWTRTPAAFAAAAATADAAAAAFMAWMDAMTMRPARAAA